MQNDLWYVRSSISRKKLFFFIFHSFLNSLHHTPLCCISLTTPIPSSPFIRRSEKVCFLDEEIYKLFFPIKLTMSRFMKCIFNYNNSLIEICRVFCCASVFFFVSHYLPYDTQQKKKEKHKKIVMKEKISFARKSLRSDSGSGKETLTI